LKDEEQRLVRHVGSIIILVRHGETSWNKKLLLQGRTDVSLSDKGRKQAKTLSSTLSSVPISSIHSSPLVRALETAEILGAPHGITPEADDGLAEISFGDWEGKSHEDLRRETPEQYEKWIVNPKEVLVPEAETLNDAQFRVTRSFERIKAKNEGKVTMIVGHGGINRILLLTLLQADLDSFWRLRQDTACLNLVEFSDGSPRISLVNSTAHFGTDYQQIVKEAMSRAKISTEDQN
jgi:alpha-ribazole phosphatase